MNTTKSSITVRLLEDKPAILMQWEHHVRDEDIDRAYHTIRDLLDLCNKPQSIILDLTHSPRIPMVATLIGALHGPHTHPRLHEWLIVGKHHSGLMLARILSRTIRKHAVIQFDTIAEAHLYLTNTAQNARHI